MSAYEAPAFEAAPLFTPSTKLREWNEIAKGVNIPLPDLNSYKIMAIKHLEANK